MLYDIHATFEDNLKRGFFCAVPEQKLWKKIFDYDVRKPIGVSACPLTATVDGMRLCSAVGFDVIVSKTIRSRPSSAHPHPNVVPIVCTLEEDAVCIADHVPADPNQSGLANSIGNASVDLQSACHALDHARCALADGQILIASLYGTGEDKAACYADFVLLARSVQEIRVHAIELNLSCPNVHGFGYRDTDFVFEVTRAVTAAVSCPVIIKAGYCSSVQEIDMLLAAIARAGGRGIAGINSIPARVHAADGQPYFGASRERAGVSGAPIRSKAYEWLCMVADCNAKQRYGLTIFGGGGITRPADFDLFINAGADVALCATGALYDITLAAQYAALKSKEWYAYTCDNVTDGSHNEHERG